MLTIIQKSPNLANALKATTYVVPSSSAPAVTFPYSYEHKPEPDPPKVFFTVSKLKSALPIGLGTPQAITGITNKTQYRFSHTDVTVPDNSEYRRFSNKDPTVPYRDGLDNRRTYTYLITAGALSFASVGGKTVLTKVAKYYGFNQDSLALGALELDIGSVPEGKSVTFKWQGKPLFVKHRTAAEIADCESVALAELRDPEEDAKRVQKPKWLVTLGICTHLGCVPIANKGDYLGGYFCPCHGSHYDAAGRIRKGPAPENLAIPPYKFIDDTVILVG